MLSDLYLTKTYHGTIKICQDEVILAIEHLIEVFDGGLIILHQHEIKRTTEIADDGAALRNDARIIVNRSEVCLYLCLIQHRFLTNDFETTAQESGSIEVRQRLLEIDVLAHAVALLVVRENKHRLHFNGETLVLDTAASSIVVA